MNVLREEPDVGKPQVRFCEECGAVTLPFTRPERSKVLQMEKAIPHTVSMILKRDLYTYGRRVKALME